MGNISNQKLETTESFRHFGGSVFSHLSPETMNKNNIRETIIKGNIWGPFYIPKGEGSDGG